MRQRSLGTSHSSGLVKFYVGAPHSYLQNAPEHGYRSVKACLTASLHLGFLPPGTESQAARAQQPRGEAAKTISGPELL